MTTINMYSKQRGRVIDYRTLTYGYWRYDPLHGADTILDMLLTYRKYRGHKMTVPVRRHAYLQQTFTGKLSQMFFNYFLLTKKRLTINFCLKYYPYISRAKP